MADSVILAGGTGHLGGKIAASLLDLGASVRAIVRTGSEPDRTQELRRQGATIVEVDYKSRPDLARACKGGTCVVSALSGLRDVIVDAQTRLLDAAVDAGVVRFIPSDYAVDFKYLHNMFDGRAKLTPLDNTRYPDIRWTGVRDVLRQWPRMFKDAPAGSGGRNT